MGFIKCNSTHFPSDNNMYPCRFISLFFSIAKKIGASDCWFFSYRYGVELVYKQQPLIRGRGVSYCKNLLSPRFEHAEGNVSIAAV